MTESAEEYAQETLDWIKNFRRGVFHVVCGNCGSDQHLPPEFYGIVLSAERLANDVLGNQ